MKEVLKQTYPGVIKLRETPDTPAPAPGKIECRNDLAFAFLGIVMLFVVIFIIIFFFFIFIFMVVFFFVFFVAFVSVIFGSRSSSSSSMLGLAAAAAAVAVAAAAAPAAVTFGNDRWLLGELQRCNRTGSRHGRMAPPG